MPVLVACECTQEITSALRTVGVEAYSCDIKPSGKNKDWHIQGDVIPVLNAGAIVLENGSEITIDKWDGLIAHPECTFLSNSGVKHLYIDGKKENGINKNRWVEMQRAAEFFNKFKRDEIPFIAIENPIMHGYAQELTGGKADQYIQPWWFGSKKNKATGFRLKGLPKLIKTNVVGPMPKTVLKGTKEYRDWNECWYMSAGKDRSAKRARTDPSVAKAIAEQWGIYFNPTKEGVNDGR